MNIKFKKEFQSLELQIIPCFINVVFSRENNSHFCSRAKIVGFSFKIHKMTYQFVHFWVCNQFNELFNRASIYNYYHHIMLTKHTF